MPRLPCVKGIGFSARPLELDPRPTISWACVPQFLQVKKGKDSTSSQNYHRIKWFNSAEGLTQTVWLMASQWWVATHSHSTLVKRGCLSSQKCCLCAGVSGSLQLCHFSNIDSWASQCSDTSGLEHSVPRRMCQTETSDVRSAYSWNR